MIKLSHVLLITITIIITIFFYNKSEHYDEHFTPTSVLVEYKILKNNISLLKKVTKFLENNNIEYWAQGNTLLGAVRDHGMTPWNNKNQINICDKNIEKLLFKKDELKTIDLRIEMLYNEYKIYELSNSKSSCVDLFVVTKNNEGDYVYKNNHTKKMWNIIFKKDDIYPLKKYKYENFYIYSMNNPYPFLNTIYPNWNKKGYNGKSIEFPIEYDKNAKPYLWVYWENKNNNKIPAYIDLCIKTIMKNCSDSFNIIKLDEKSIYTYLPEMIEYKQYTDKLRIAHKVDIYRIMLLYKYGGLYVDADTIVLRNPYEIIKKLDEHEYVGFGCTGDICTYGYNNPSNGIMAARPHSFLMGKVLDNVLKKIKNQSNFNYFDIGKLLIWEELKNIDDYDYYHYPNKFDGTRDKDGNWITNDIIFSNRTINYEDENNMIFFIMYNSLISDMLNNMSESELLSKDWNYTKFLKKGLHLS